MENEEPLYPAPRNAVSAPSARELLAPSSASTPVLARLEWSRDRVQIVPAKVMRWSRDRVLVQWYPRPGAQQPRSTWLSREDVRHDLRYHWRRG
jgi:hypothetical protein